MDTIELEKIIKEYLDTRDDKDKDDWYATARTFADGELSRFLKWLKERN